MVFLRRKRFYFFLAGFLLFFIFIDNLEAVIYETAGIGAKSVAMIGSIVATADDPIDSLYFNPATLSQVEGTNVTAGMGIVSFPVEYKNSDGYKDTSNTRPIIPYFGYTTDRFDPFFWGIGVYSNFGAGFEFQEDPAHGVYGDMRSLIGVLSLNPTLACQINPKWVVGIQGNLGYSKAEIDLPILTEALKTESDGFGFGASIGILYKPITYLSIGFKWRSPLKFALDGDARLSNSKKDDLKIYLYYPQAFSIGLGYLPTDRLTLELDFTWYDWSYFGRSRFSYDTLHFLNGPMSGGMKDCYRISMGIEHLFKKSIVMRTGYLYNPAATKEDWISPLGPDIGNHNLGLGVGFEMGDFQIDLSFLYTYVPDKNISSNESKSGFPGKYSTKFFDLTLGITHFKF